jgi:tubulin beta
MSSYSIFPSPKVSDVVVEPYNAMLSIHQLIENVDEVAVIDNEALYDILNKSMGIKTPKFKDLNALIAQCVSGTTSCLRFPGQLNSDLRKLGVNLIPFPRLHFFLISTAPLTSAKNEAYTVVNAKTLIDQVFDVNSMMAACDPRFGKYLTASLIFRGPLASKAVDEQVARIQKANADFFAPWIPHNIKSSLCNMPPLGQGSGCTLIGNNTAIMDIFQRIQEAYSKMFNKKAFVHWYTGEGMDEMEMTEAESNVIDLIQEYTQYRDATVEEEAPAE